MMIMLLFGFSLQFVEYIIGDGPSNRYALICRQCFSHNGMALKEDFEFISMLPLICLRVSRLIQKRKKISDLMNNSFTLSNCIKNVTSLDIIFSVQKLYR